MTGAWWECPDCNGTGEVADHRNYWGRWETRTCGRCGGTGDVPAPEPFDMSGPTRHRGQER